MKKQEFIENVAFQLKKMRDELPRRSAVAKALKRCSDADIRSIAINAWDEFQKRPRLKQVVLVNYKRHSRSLGKGCMAVVIYPDGAVTYERRQGEYGCIVEI